MSNTMALLLKWFSINSLCKSLDPQGKNPINHGGLALCILDYTYLNDESSNLQLHFHILFLRTFFLSNFLFLGPLLLAPPYRGPIFFFSIFYFAINCFYNKMRVIFWLKCFFSAQRPSELVVSLVICQHLTFSYNILFLLLHEYHEWNITLSFNITFVMGDCHQHYLLIPNMETRDGFQNKSIIKLTKYKFH
jgi:hypothetical protein